MARTRSADYDDIQDMIIQRAAAFIARKGYNATSIGDIAEACDCSKSRLYHYFEGKDAILRTMLNGHIDSLLERCRQVFYGSSEPKQRFLQLVKLFLEIYAVSRDQHVVLLTSLEDLPAADRDELITKQRELIAYVRDALLQQRPEMAQNRVLARVDTMLFFGMINWTYTWYKADGAVTPEQLAERAVELFLNGYGSMPAKL